MIRAFKWIMRGIAALIAVPLLYLAVAWIGAYLVLPSTLVAVDTSSKQHSVYLLTGPLHADIAIEATTDIINRLDFLRQTPVPIDNPNLRYLSFGWGSKAFYTTAGSYSDIEANAVFMAVTGDDAVMRVVGYGDVSKAVGSVRVEMTAHQFDALLGAIEEGFARNAEGNPIFMQGVSIGQQDSFFEDTGRFNIFYPCNQWVRDVLVKSGLAMGAWTPTTYSLTNSLHYHNSGPQAVQP